jgi:hypothetical protein
MRLRLHREILGEGERERLELGNEIRLRFVRLGGRDGKK